MVSYLLNSGGARSVLASVKPLHTFEFLPQKMT